MQSFVASRKTRNNTTSIRLAVDVAALVTMPTAQRIIDPSGNGDFWCAYSGNKHCRQLCRNVDPGRQGYGSAFAKTVGSGGYCLAGKVTTKGGESEGFSSIAERAVIRLRPKIPHARGNYSFQMGVDRWVRAL